MPLTLQFEYELLHLGSYENTDLSYPKFEEWRNKATQIESGYGVSLGIWRCGASQQQGCHQ